MSKEIIYRFGTLMKEEQVVPVTAKIIPGTMVLETPEPFPGYLTYYSETPHDPKPIFIYFGLDDNSHYESVARATSKVLKKSNTKFSAAFGSISIKHDIYKVLRIKYINSFDEVLPIQELFAKEGVVFRKQITQSQPETALIRLKKMFKTRPLEDGLFQSVNDNKIAYFPLPVNLEWLEFKALISKVRHNWNKELVDFAAATVYKYDGVEDLVRVYSPAMRPELLKELRQIFNEKV